MNFRLANNHILLDLKEGTFLLDTGRPESFSFESINTISIEDRHHIIAPNNPHNDNRTAIEELIGENVCGFIGMNTLQEYNGITIDYPNHDIIFIPKEGIVCFNFEIVQGHLVTQDCTINGRELSDVVFDTGAYISYVRRNYINVGDIQKDKVFHDVDSQGQTFDGNLYRAILGSKLLENGYYISKDCFEVGVDNPYFDVLPINAFINPIHIALNGTTLLNNVISIDFNTKTISCIYGESSRGED